MNSMVTIDQILVDKLDNWFIGEWPIGNFIACTIAMLLSVILCGAIGIERERRGRSAGLRTHLLVGVGSCMIMIISIYGFPKIDLGNGVMSRDVARLAAQVITGVGFLGAGAIIHRNSGIKGLTTAATIWVAMAIGLACGSMNFILAAGGTLLIIVVLTLFRRVEAKINRSTPLIVVRANPEYPIVSKILTITKHFDCTVNDLKSDIAEDGRVEVTFLAVSNTENLDTTGLIKKLENIEGVVQVEVLNAHVK